ncbi:hypothetical protein H4R24_000648 [Coemansia sp. RSA 988]|nr:hypothetical protein H4R24_000648 [Coemansia sp. RSA 988]
MVHIVREFFWRLCEFSQSTTDRTAKSDACHKTGALRNTAINTKPRTLKRAYNHKNTTRSSVKCKLQRLCRPKAAAVLEITPYDPIDDIISMYYSMPENDPDAAIRKAKELAYKLSLDIKMQEKKEAMQRNMQPSHSCLKNPAKHQETYRNMPKKHVHFNELIDIRLI